MKIKRKFLFLCVALMIACLYRIQFNNINHKYPPAQLISYAKDQTVSYDGFSLKVLSTEFFNENDLKKNNKELYENIYIENEEIKAIVVDIQITNNNKQNAEIDISDAWLQSNYWVNGIVMNAFVAINPAGTSLHPKLKSGETVRLKLPYTMIPAHFKEMDWNNVQNRKYDLILTFYPIKRALALN